MHARGTHAFHSWTTFVALWLGARGTALHKLSRYSVLISAMRGPSSRVRSGLRTVAGVATVWFIETRLGAFVAVSGSFADLWPLSAESDDDRTRRFGRTVRAGRCSTTSRQKRPNVSNATLTPSASSASRMSRYDAPFCRNSAIPSLNGISFAYRFCPTGLKFRAKSVNCRLRDSSLVPSLIRKSPVSGRTDFSKPA